MATGTVVSAMVVQKKQEGSFVQFWPSFVKSSPCSRCCQNGPLCSIPPHHSIQRDADIPRRTLTRRDAISLFLQAALLSVSSSNAQAAEGSFERVKGLEHVQSKNELYMKLLLDVRSVPELIPKLFLGKLAGFVLAYQRAQKSPGSSLGFLGCLVFGLLFLKEKQAKTANNTSLEDVQVRIKQAETELCSQTRSSVRYKLEESQLENCNGRGTSVNEALQCQLVKTKFSIDEKVKQLGVKKDLSELLKRQATGLMASVKEIEKDCISLLAHVNKQLKIRDELEAELQSMIMDLECNAMEISSLKASVENLEEANNKMAEKVVVVESSLKESNKHVLDAEEKIESLRNCVLVTDGSAESLAKELRFIGTRNQTLEGELSELSMHLQSEQATLVQHLAEQNRSLNLRGEEVDVWSAELLYEQNEFERNFEHANQLTNQRDDLMMAVSEMKFTFDGLKEMLDSNQEILRKSQNELATLQEQVFHELAHSTALDSGLKDNGVLWPLSKASLEVENQISTQKDMTERLEKELHITSQALNESKVEISALQDTIQSLLSSQAQLQRGMAKLTEEQQVITQALKKEKRATAYAKKQLALSKEIILEEGRVMEELCNDLEKAKRLIDDSKEQISAKASELERVTETALCLSNEAFQSTFDKSVLNEDQALQVGLGGSSEVLTAASNPIRRKNIAKRTTPKMQRSPRKSSVQASQYKRK